MITYELAILIGLIVLLIYVLFALLLKINPKKNNNMHVYCIFDSCSNYNIISNLD